MKLFKWSLTLLLTLILSISLLAQDEPDNEEEKEEKKWRWEWEWDELDLGFRKSQPAISLQYGLATLKRDDFGLEFAKPNLVELKLGYIKDKKAWETENIIKHSYKFIYLSNSSTELSGNTNIPTEFQTDMWRFGFGRTSGYGYKIGESAAIIPYYGYTLNWSRVNIKERNIGTFAPIDAKDEAIINYYDESFRFGTSSEGGIRIKPICNLIIDAGYERSIVFQRHLFWKWAGSAVLESAVHGLLDTFINEIFESSPNAGPVVNFLLKNALAYGIYELRQDKMNWPFNSEAPLAYDQFKFGLTFVF